MTFTNNSSSAQSIDDAHVLAPGEPDSNDSPSKLSVELRAEIPELEDAFIVPLWFVQQTTWLTDALGSDSADYNYPLLFTIRGKLNSEALERSLNEIVRRHQVLRSVFRLKDGDLVQIVLRPKRQRLASIDLLKFPEASREERLHQLCYEEARRPFNLATDPLLRSTIIRTAPDHHLLQLTTHHLVHDDWSTGILVREITELYHSLATEMALPLDYLPFQYGDYVRWLEEQLKEIALLSRMSYWKEQLGATAAFHHVPTDFVSSENTITSGGRETIVIPAELAESLKLLGRKERVSLFMVLLAGFKALLHCYSKDDEIGVASCAANRPLPQVEGLMGRFGNHIFLRTSLAGNPTFRDLLGRMREVALNVYADQGLPFGEILKATKAGLSFQAMFLLQNAQREHREISSLDIKPFPFYSGTAKHNLTILLKVDPFLKITAEYKVNLFRAATIKQLLVDYRAILEMMASNPAATVTSFISSQPSKVISRHGKLLTSKEVVNNSNGAECDLQMLDVWRDTFDQPVGLDQNFFELGGDSLLATRLFRKIEKTFSLRLPVSVLLEAPTIRQLSELVSDYRVRKPGSSLVPIQTSGTKPPLFCVHGHLGEVFYCRTLSHALGPEQPLFGLRSQGLAGETPFHAVSEMAHCYVKEIQTVQQTGPYYFSGWCFGGMIACEMAQLLREQGEQVALLLLFNTPAPGSLQGWPLTPGYLRRRVAHELKKLGDLGVKQKLTVFRTKTLGLARLTSGTVKTNFHRYFVNGAAATKVSRSLSVPDINVAAAKAYRPQVYPGTITMFLTDEVRSIYGTDPAKGWVPFAEKGIELHSASGDNQSLFHSPHVETLAKTLKACLAKAQAN